MRKVILPKGMLELFKNLGCNFYTKRKSYHSFPLWIEQDYSTGETTIRGIDELPDEIFQLVVNSVESLDVAIEDKSPTDEKE